MATPLKTSLSNITSTLKFRAIGPRLLRTTPIAAQRSYATATPLATHQSISTLLNDSIAAGKHTVTAVQCTVLQQPEANVIDMAPKTLGPGEEDTKLGYQSAGVPDGSEKMVRVQALVELVVKAKDFGEVEGMRLLKRE